MTPLKKLYDKTKDFLTSEQTNILRAGFSLMIVIGIIKISGFLASSIITSRVGASRESDLFYLANTIPEMLGNLVLVGLAGAVFVPVFVKAKNTKNGEKFLKVFNSLLNLSLIMFVVISLILIVYAKTLFPVLLNTFVYSSYKFSDADLLRAADMMRILMIPQVFLGFGAFYTGALNAYNRFIIPQLAPFFYNLGRIIGAYFLIPIWGIEGLVYGTIIGSILHTLVQLPLAKQIGIKYLPIIDLKDNEVFESIKVGVPRMLGLTGEQIALAANRIIASRFVQGSVTAYNLGVQLVSIPLSLIGLTFSIASFPSLAHAHQTDNKTEFSRIYLGTIHQILFMSVPITVILLILRLPLVRLLYGLFGGEFVWDDTVLTAWVVLFLSIGLAFESLRTFMYRAFYAVGDTVRPLAVLTFTMIFGVTTSILFANYFSNYNEFDIQNFTWNLNYLFTTNNGYPAVGGSALSSSITYFIEYIILTVLFYKYVYKFPLKDFVITVGKKLLAGILMALIMLPVFRLWGDSTYQENTIPLAFLSFLTIFVGIVSYVILSFLLRIKEVTLFTSLARKISPKSVKEFLNYMDEQL